MSPVEIWGMPYFWQMKAACVPLPAPGAPNKISFMEVLEESRNSCLPDRPTGADSPRISTRSEEHTSELQSQSNLVCRLLLEKKKKKTNRTISATSMIIAHERRKMTLHV